ncbi:hypothetical protein J6590_057760 [Homalodisca vitripennis]|nr:hypothetical protein J6590_057760 [Homalodisca vitripennis]
MEVVLPDTSDTSVGAARPLCLQPPQCGVVVRVSSPPTSSPLHSSYVLNGFIRLHPVKLDIKTRDSGSPLWDGELLGKLNCCTYSTAIFQGSLDHINVTCLTILI